MNFDLDYILQLAQNHEGVDIEFKETTGQLDRGMETLCGMLNGDGGIVVFGIKNSGKIVGQEIGDKTTRTIGEALRRFEPAVEIQPKYVKITDSDKKLIVFEAEGNNPDRPYSYDGRPYQRHDSVTSVMPHDRHSRMIMHRGGLRYKWDTLPNENLKFEDLDESRIHWAIRQALELGRLKDGAYTRDPIAILEKFKVLKNGVYTNAAAVLFGKDFFYYHNCIIRLARFRGKDKREFIDNQQIEGNIFDLLNEVTPFFLKHLSVTSRFEGMYRKDELEVPINALRECCANALAHMDWRRTASVGVAIYDDRIEIENPGMLPEEIPAEKLTYGSHILASHTSDPPNEIIARGMYYSGVIEHWGRGLAMIFEECNRAGLPQPTVTDEMGVVRVTFMRPNLSGHKHDPINDPINDPIKILSEVEKLVLHIVKEHPGISRVNIAPIIDKSEATVKRALRALVEMGFVEYRGSNKTGGYFSLLSTT